MGRVNKSSSDERKSDEAGIVGLISHPLMKGTLMRLGIVGLISHPLMKGSLMRLSIVGLISHPLMKGSLLRLGLAHTYIRLFLWVCS